MTNLIKSSAADNQETALILATRHGHLHIIKDLLAKGASLNVKSMSIFQISIPLMHSLKIVMVKLCLKWLSGMKS